MRFIICESPEHGLTCTYSRHEKIDCILVHDKLDLFIILDFPWKLNIVSLLLEYEKT